MLIAIFNRWIKIFICQTNEKEQDEIKFYQYNAKNRPWNFCALHKKKSLPFSALRNCYFYLLTV